MNDRVRGFYKSADLIMVDSMRVINVKRESKREEASEREREKESDGAEMLRCRGRWS